METEELREQDGVFTESRVQGCIVQVTVEVSGFIVDISGQSSHRNGERDVEEGKRGVRFRPGESERRVETGSKINELFQFRTRGGSSTNAIIDISEKELWVGFRIELEQAMFHVPHEETGITGAHAVTHGHPSDLKKMSGVRREVVEEAQHQLSDTSLYFPLDYDPIMTHQAIVSTTVRGVAMGTRMGPSYACLFKGYFRCLRRICSDEANFDKAASETSIFLKQEFPSSIVDRALNR
eukprot:g34257.t1